MNGYITIQLFLDVSLAGAVMGIRASLHLFFAVLLRHRACGRWQFDFADDLNPSVMKNIRVAAF